MMNIFSIKQRAYPLALIVFIACLFIGSKLAQQKPLWNDEIFTQARNIDKATYLDLILLRFDDGNKCPLFYVIQKIISDALQFTFPDKPWSDVQNVYDAKAQMIMRITSNFYMSLGIALIFFFFARYFSLGSALYSLAVSLSTFMVWAYWAEARPYGLWFLLTVIQLLLFIRISKIEGLTHANSQNDRLSWSMLAVTHICLSLTIVVSAAQVFIVSCLLWIFQPKGRLKIKWIFMTLVPLCFSVFYYFHTAKYQYWFSMEPVMHVFICYPRDRLIILGLLLLAWIGFCIKKRSELPKGLGRFLLLTLSILTVGFSFLAYFIKIDTGGPEGFVISFRYWIFLTPFNIIATTLCSLYLIRLFKWSKWMQVNIVLLIGGLLIIRILKTYGMFLILTLIHNRYI